MTLQCFYESVFAPLKLRSRTARTKELYLTTLRNFRRFLQREPTLSDLTDDTVSAYLAAFSNKHSPYTVNKERSNLLAIWRFACRKNVVNGWPDVDAEVQPRRIPQAWTREELCRLFGSLREVKGEIAGVPAAAWWTSLHLVAWDSGERITALMQAQWGDVDLTGGYLRVPAEHRKGRRTDRLYRIAIDTIASLRAIGQPPRELVWPWPLHPTYLWTRYGALLKKAGLPHDARSKFHRIRRSVASYVEAGGMNATDFLGHSSRSVTLRYLDPRIVGEKHAIDVLFRPVPH